MARTEWDRSIELWIDQLRGRGDVVLNAAHVPDPDTWRRAMRAAARRAGLRIRTGLTEGGALWAIHVDHVVTEAEMSAVALRFGAIYDGEQLPPFEQLVRQEQRKLMQIVPTDPEA